VKAVFDQRLVAEKAGWAIDDTLKPEALEMTNGSDRRDRIEGILETVSSNLRAVSSNLQTVSSNLQEVTGDLQEVAKRQREMAARQQYHDEAFERHDSEMKSIREAIAADAENIRALVRIEEPHRHRLEGLEGGEAV
jgi:DNA repair ATPase RecN